MGFEEKIKVKNVTVGVSLKIVNSGTLHTHTHKPPNKPKENF
jgi:hypothetical protein